MTFVAVVVGSRGYQSEKPYVWDDGGRLGNSTCVPFKASARRRRLIVQALALAGNLNGEYDALRVAVSKQPTSNSDVFFRGT